MSIEAIRWAVGGAIAAMGVLLLAIDNEAGWIALFVALLVTPL